MYNELKIHPQNNINENGNLITTQVVCDKCRVPTRMEQTAPGIFYCVNGHKKALYDLTPIEEKKKEEQVKRIRRIETKCKFCGKIATIDEESRIAGRIRRRYSCGHTELLNPLTPPANRDEVWNKLYEFQRTGVEFVENANYQAQISDEMGLGKTIQALAVLRYNYSELTPCLMVCEASKVYDWKSEFESWVGDRFNAIEDKPIIHNSGKFGIVPGWKNHIISMSLLQKPKVLESILEYGFKFVIVDESHSFKNVDAERTYAIQRITSPANVYKLFLSGTPIMNKVMEYFVPLNILRPTHFPSQAFIADRCDRHSNGRILGLKNWYRPKFFHQISEYVIRRTKKDAGIKLPEFRLNSHFTNIGTDISFKKGYSKLIEDLEEILMKRKESAGVTQDLLGIFAKMRHFVGLAKVKPIISLVEEYLESMDPEEKITIGVHHKLVMEYLEKGLSTYNPIVVSDEHPHIKMLRIEEFKKPERRVLIASILGAGQGLNIQFCKNAIIAEREWNPAKEDQFCGRFHRIQKNPDGSLKNEFIDGVDSVTVDCINAKDTIDEFFEALINLKKQIVGSTLDQNFTYDPEFLLDLAQKIVNSKDKIFKMGAY